jgi:hypothetical protein
MRTLVLALALAACGAPTPEPTAEVATTSGMDLSGHLIAVGDGYRLDAIPDQNATILAFPAEDMTVSGPYVMPEATDTGAHLQSIDISLTLTPQACTWDGATYPLTAVVQITNSRPLNGCALIAWDHHLQELIPQIDACIAQAPAQNWVSYAGRSGDDTIVRLRGETAPLHCVVRGGTATVTPAEGEPKIAGDGEALFVRGSSGPNPGGECAEAPEVRSANGELIGWMMDPLGC